MSHQFINNPQLRTRTLPFEWQGTPIDINGRFLNHEIPHNHSFKEFLKWQTSKNEHKAEKKNSIWQQEVIFNNFTESDMDGIVWLGHASFFIRLNGINILIDPILFNLALIKRNTALPIEAEAIKNIDIILISHDHRDHLDEKSLKLLSRNNPNATYLSGLNNQDLIKQFSSSNKIQVAGWYQEYHTEYPIRITYVPSRHWGRRLIRDTNQRLWGGFLIESNNKTIYFGGDSGYGTHFSDIGLLAQKIDYALLGIGAYKPEFFMGQSHMSPKDSLQAFEDSKALNMIPMHHSTFDLSDEPLQLPEQELRRIQKEQGPANNILYPKIGEYIIL